MASKKKPKHRERQPRAAPAESSASLFVTVGWSISVLVTLVFLVTASQGELLVGRNRPADDTAFVFVQLLRWSAVVTASVSLALIPVVYRVRPTRPPTGFLVFAVFVATLAILSGLR